MLPVSEECGGTGEQDSIGSGKASEDEKEWGAWKLYD